MKTQSRRHRCDAVDHILSSAQTARYTGAADKAVNLVGCKFPHHQLPELPSSQAASRLPGPLRTGRESFPSSGSSPSNASCEETRFRYVKTLAMNPVMALRM